MPATALKLVMRFLHISYAQLAVVKSVAMHHFYTIDDFLVDKAAFLTPSPLGCCQPRKPAFPLTLLARWRDWNNTKSRIAKKRSGFYFLFFLPLLSEPIAAEEITVATAANFQLTLKELQAPFSKQTGHRLKIIAGSSGSLATQIINGAPFDIFLSADISRARQLVEKGFAEKSSLSIYAYGKLSLWSPNNKFIADNNGKMTLQAGKFNHLALANPTLAPYGLASIETLRSLNLFFQLSDKLVQGENISQTFAMLATGAAPVGFVARSQLAGPPWNKTGSYWHVPTNLHTPIKQAAVLVKSSKNKPAGRQFIGFLKSVPAEKIIKSFGYDVEEE